MDERSLLRDAKGSSGSFAIIMKDVQFLAEYSTKDISILEYSRPFS